MAFFILGIRFVICDTKKSMNLISFKINLSGYFGIVYFHKDIINNELVLSKLVE